MSVPDEVVLLVKLPGAAVLTEDVEKAAGITCLPEAPEDFLYDDGAAALSPVVGVAVEGDQFSPGGQVGGAEAAHGVPGGSVHPGRAVGGAAEGKAFLIQQKSVVDALLIVLPEDRNPAVVGDLPGQIAGRDTVPIGGPPAQGMETGHILKILLCMGIDQAQFYHLVKKDCILVRKEI